MSNKLIQKAFANIDTVQGHCEECGEDSILVAIVSEFYRCTNCGADTRQHVNGSIRYIKLTESDKAYIKSKWPREHLNISYPDQSLVSGQVVIRKA